MKRRPVNALTLFRKSNECFVCLFILIIVIVCYLFPEAPNTAEPSYTFNGEM